MKKTALIILTMILVLAMGQSVLASNSAGLKLGYVNESGKLHFVAPINTAFNGFLIGLSADYYFNSNISAAIKANASFGTLAFGNGNTPAEYKYFTLDGQLFAKYDAFSTSMFTIAPQLGVIYEYSSLKLEHALLPNTFSERNMNSLFIAAGVFVNANISPKLDVYLDTKFPVFYFVSDNLDSTSDSKNGFFEYFFYDLTIGGTYAIASNIGIGLEVTASNSNSLSLASKAGDLSSNKFSIGAKAVLKF